MNMFSLHRAESKRLPLIKNTVFTGEVALIEIIVLFHVQMRHQPRSLLFYFLVYCSLLLVVVFVKNMNKTLGHKAEILTCHFVSGSELRYGSPVHFRQPQATGSAGGAAAGGNTDRNGEQSGQTGQ